MEEPSPVNEAPVNEAPVNEAPVNEAPLPPPAFPSFTIDPSRASTTAVAPLMDPTIDGRPRALRHAELMPAWRVATIAAWVGITVGFLAVWRSSWTMGLPTWWLGPQADSRSWLIIAIPFIAPVVMVILAAVSVRHLWVYGLIAALITSNVAWGDVGRVNGYALVEFALALAGLAVSVASYGGMARRVEGRAE